MAQAVKQDEQNQQYGKSQVVNTSMYTAVRNVVLNEQHYELFSYKADKLMNRNWQHGVSHGLSSAQP